MSLLRVLHPYLRSAPSRQVVAATSACENPRDGAATHGVRLLDGVLVACPPCRNPLQGGCHAQVPAISGILSVTFSGNRTQRSAWERGQSPDTKGEFTRVQFSIRVQFLDGTRSENRTAGRSRGRRASPVPRPPLSRVVPRSRLSRGRREGERPRARCSRRCAPVRHLRRGNGRPMRQLAAARGPLEVPRSWYMDAAGAFEPPSLFVNFGPVCAYRDHGARIYRALIPVTQASVPLNGWSNRPRRDERPSRRSTWRRCGRFGDPAGAGEKRTASENHDLGTSRSGAAFCRTSRRVDVSTEWVTRRPEAPSHIYLGVAGGCVAGPRDGGRSGAGRRRGITRTSPLASGSGKDRGGSKWVGRIHCESSERPSASGVPATESGPR